MRNLKPASLKTFVSGFLSYEAPRPPMPKIEPLLPAQDYITKPVEPQGDNMPRPMPQSVRGIQPLLPNIY